MRADTLIVGGGVMGTSIAMYVAQRSDPLDQPVVLFERRDLGSGSSGRSGAILRQHYADPVVARMARDSLREYSTFEARTGRSVGFVRTGVLTLAGPDQPEWCERVRENVAMLKELGIDTEIVEDQALTDLVPGISIKRGTVGAWEPDGGFADPHRTLESFASLARSSGAVTRLGTTVEKIHVEGGKVVGASTTEGDYVANKVCVVAGPWSARLLKPLGVELPLRVIRPENHFVIMPESEELEHEDEYGPHAEPYAAGLSFDDIQDPVELAVESDARATRGLHPVIIDLEQSLYVRCEPDHRRTRLGRTDYEHDEVLEDPDQLSEEVSDGLIEWSRQALVRRMPMYDQQPDAASQAAWYTLTPDAQAVIGEVPGIAGLFVVTGFSGHGFKLAPTVGEGMAQMLAGERVTTFEAEFFAPNRFVGGVTWGGRFGL